MTAVSDSNSIAKLFGDIHKLRLQDFHLLERFRRNMRCSFFSLTIKLLRKMEMKIKKSDRNNSILSICNVVVVLIHVF